MGYGTVYAYPFLNYGHRVSGRHCKKNGRVRHVVITPGGDYLIERVNLEILLSPKSRLIKFLSLSNYIYKDSSS